jgi:uncharacterized membrane protein (DUF485 family)
VDALPVAGAAAYMVDAKTSLVATFGKIEDDMLVATPDAFHCWVQYDGYAIDFMATPIGGTRITIGLVLGLLQFATTFAITMIYARWADRELDPAAAALAEHMERGELR